MVYNPVTDYVGLYRLAGGQVSKMEMPGLDFVVSALARAGLITLAVSATAPVVSQSTTAWLQAAVPSYSGEGVMRLWDPVATAYVAATPALLFRMLETAAGQNGVSWWTSVGGPPANVVGNNGDFAIRTDAPNGIYGPKAAGAWPAAPVPGTADFLNSTTLDNTFGTVPGDLIVRGPAVWEALPVGAAGAIMTTTGTAPVWGALSSLLDTLFGAARGSLLFRDAALWAALPPDTAGRVLATNGPGANPAWVARTAEFDSGTRIVFNQTNAPTGWTKSVVTNDVGLRLTNGAVGSVGGSAFSTVFAQTAVGNTSISISQMPSHGHTTNAPISSGSQSDLTPGSVVGVTGTATVNAAGGGGAHSHSVNLTLAYVDVIIAEKN